MTKRVEGGWLNPRRVTCPHCRAQSFQVDRSPFFDSWRLYCGSCAKSVDISYYDPVVLKLSKQHRWNSAELLSGIEQRLRVCDCGGAFSMIAPRRCHGCNGVIVSDPEVDLYAWVGPELDGRDPTDEETAAFVDYQHKFVRERDIWR